MVIIGVLMILAGLGAVGLGDSMNHDAEAQIRSVLSEGRTDPGNGLIGIGVFLIIIGVILLIAGIVSAHSNSSYSGGNSNHYNSNYSSYGYDNSQYGYSGRMQQLSKEAQERKLLDTNGWRCLCGVVNPSYTGTCGCGRTKTEVQKKQSEARQQLINDAVNRQNQIEKQNIANQKSENEKTQQEKLVTYNLRLDNIKKMKELLDAGAITQEEFDEKKKQLLDTM